MNKREWLVSKGLAKAGRGKFSNAAKAALAKAEAEGIVFDDTPAPAKAAPKPKVEKTEAAGEYVNEIMFANEMPNYGREWFIREGKKRIPVGSATVCGNCRYSLIGHVCNSPVVLRHGEFVTVEG